MESRMGFTLVELTVVILIVGILAGVAVPMMRGRIDTAKWSEANADAGLVRTTVRVYIAEKGPNHDFSNDIEGCLCHGPISRRLGITTNDLDGAYFDQDDYVVTPGSVDADAGTCVVRVGPSTKPGAPAGTGTLAADGKWSVK